MVFFSTIASPLFTIQPLHEPANNCSEIIQLEEHLHLVLSLKKCIFLSEIKDTPHNYKSYKGQLCRKKRQFNFI